jgi:hypothetical protein
MTAPGIDEEISHGLFQPLNRLPDLQHGLPMAVGQPRFLGQDLDKKHSRSLGMGVSLTLRLIQRSLRHLGGPLNAWRGDQYPIELRGIPKAIPSLRGKDFS